MCVGLVDGGLHPFQAEGELTADVDEHLGGPDGVRADDDALDELVRITLEEEVVLEGGGLALVAVDDQICRRSFATHGPLPPGREPGPAASEQADGVDLGGHLLRRHGHRLAQPFVPPGGQVALDGVRVGKLEHAR